jgi:transcriptional regulator with XRE-family HTH domain
MSIVTKTRFGNEVGRAVTRLLVDACVTQRELANRIGVPYSTLNQWITGRIPPPGELLNWTRRALRR